MSITSVLNLAAGKIGELLVEEAKLLYGVEDQVRSLQKELEMAQSFLNVMEDMDVEEGGDDLSRNTVKEIRKITYDAEDVIESYILEANSSTHKTMGDFVKRYSCFCNSLLRTHQVGFEIEAITERLNKTMDRLRKYAGENGMLGVDAWQGLNKTNRLRMMRPIAYSHTHEEHVVGLDEDINKLVGVLTHEEFKVISVVGMGGSGKTTLARKLYCHESVKKHFDCIAWVSVSQRWDAKQIILDLLKKVKGETMGADESSFSHQVLVGKIYEYLEMKSYLIVLDDVWEARALNDIRPALPLGGDKRKIIVTTRKAEVVNDPDLRPLTYSHQPRRLTDEESWELFSKIARSELNNTMDIGKLQELGKKMLKKCEGLPLAVIALAGILFDKENLEEWEKVSKVVSSRIREQGRGTLSYGSVNDMLTLSYIDLPRELKPCFLYLAQYPEDFAIRVGELVRTWIAEGFIVSREGWTLEDVARQYLNELLHRCLVLVDMKNCEGKVKYIRIHDLVRDFCIEKAKKEDFLEICTPQTLNSNTTMIQRRAALLNPQVGGGLPFPANSPHLRALFIRGSYSLSQELSLDGIHQNFSLLRVLVVEAIKTASGTLPEGIGSLIHLRYLGLRETNIKELPSSIGNLRNLLTLDCRSNTIRDVIRIPDVLWKLELLTHLSLPCDYGFDRGVIVEVKALKLHTLRYLQTLKMGSVGGVNWMLGELPRLTPTIQKLTILGIGSREQLDAAFRCPSIRNDRLHSLSLSWNDGITLDNVQESINRCQRLRRLRLDGRMVGIQFPNNLSKLVLVDTGFKAEDTLRALGNLPNLTVMSLEYYAYTGSQWTCRVGEFPQLKQLVLVALVNLEEWSIEMGAMPQLKILVIGGCLKLRKLPDGLKFITTLKRLKVYGMDDEFQGRIKGGEAAHIIKHVPRLDILR